MKRLKPWLLILLVFVAGFASGIVVTRAAVRHFVHRAVQDPDFMRAKVAARLTVNLRLDREQRARVNTILLQTQRDLKDLRQEFQPRFYLILNQAQTNISATLTPAQRQRFEQFQQENRHWWQPR